MLTVACSQVLACLDIAPIGQALHLPIHGAQPGVAEAAHLSRAFLVRLCIVNFSNRVPPLQDMGNSVSCESGEFPSVDRCLSQRWESRCCMLCCCQAVDKWPIAAQTHAGATQLSLGKGTACK